MKIRQPKVDPAIQALVSKGYLVPNADGQSYRLTEKGQAYMDSTCATPSSSSASNHAQTPLRQLP